MLNNFISTFTLVVFFASSAFSQSVINTSFVHDGLERNFDLYVPSSYNPADEAVSLIFNFHGFGSDAFQQRFYSNMGAVADTANFLVCYPNGVDNAWNVGWAFGSTEDDVGFVSAMIDMLMEDYNINPKRIYSCGMSNGGFFSYKLACELSDKIAAVASVTGSMVPGQETVCMPELQTPVLEIHGTADDVVGYNGSTGVAIPTLEVIDHWNNINNCDVNEVVEFNYPDIASADGCTADRFEYTFCDEDLEVVLIRINGGGHTWPGAFFDIGVTNQDFDASSEIWNFFNKFERKIGTGIAETNDLDQLIILSPNPSNGELSIQNLDNKIELVQVFDASLKLVRKKVIKTEGEIIFTNLKTGSYYAQIIANGQTIFKPFIVL